MSSDKISEDTYVCVIGCANIDIAGFPDEELKLRDSNQGRLNISLGGVGRNIAENLSRLNITTELITVIGDDDFSQRICQHCRKMNIKIDNSLFLKDQNSALHLAVMDRANDLAVAISAMDLYDHMDIEFIATKKDVVTKSLLTVLDTSIPQDVIEYILNNIKSRRYYVEVDAASKTKRLLNVLGRIHYLKLNVIEAEILFKRKIDCDDEIVNAADYLHDRGVKVVIITMGQRGLFYSHQKSGKFVESISVNVVNSNGAGDAMTAGIVYGIICDNSIEEAIDLGMACARIALQHKDTVSDLLTVQNMKSLIN